MKHANAMQPTCKTPKKPTATLFAAAILIASISLLAGCAAPGKPPRPDLPYAFHFLEPGTTNTVVIPADAAYGIWTTDRGLLYLQGLTP